MLTDSCSSFFHFSVTFRVKITSLDTCLYQVIKIDRRVIRASHVTLRLWRKQLEERGTEYEQNRRHNNPKQALKLLSCCALWQFVSRKETKMSTHFSANQVMWNRLYFSSRREEIRGVKRCFSLVIYPQNGAGRCANPELHRISIVDRCLETYIQLLHLVSLKWTS